MLHSLQHLVSERSYFLEMPSEGELVHNLLVHEPTGLNYPEITLSLTLNLNFYLKINRELEELSPTNNALRFMRSYAAEANQSGKSCYPVDPRKHA